MTARSDGDRRLLLTTALEALAELADPAGAAALRAEMSAAERGDGPETPGSGPVTTLPVGAVRVLPGRDVVYVDDPAVFCAWLQFHGTPDALAGARLGSAFTEFCDRFGDIPGTTRRSHGAAVMVPVPAGQAIARHANGSVAA